MPIGGLIAGKKEEGRSCGSEGGWGSGRDGFSVLQVIRKILCKASKRFKRESVKITQKWSHTSKFDRVKALRSCNSRDEIFS